MTTAYLLNHIPPDVHADLKHVAERQQRTIKQVLMIAIDREIQRTLKNERKSKHCPIVQR